MGNPLTPGTIDTAFVGCPRPELPEAGLLGVRAAGNGPAAQFVALGMAAAFGITLAFLVVFGWSVSGQRFMVRTKVPAILPARALAVLANRDGFCLTLWAPILLGRPTWIYGHLRLGPMLIG